MKIDLSTLLTDKKSFPDTFELTLSNGATMTAGDLRAWNASQHGALQQELTARKAELEKEADRVQRAATNVATMYQKLAERGLLDNDGNVRESKPKARMSHVNDGADPDPFDALEQDAYLAPVAKLLKTINANVEGLKNNDGLKNLEKGISKAALTFMNRELARDYDGLKVKPEGYDLKKLTELALNRKIYTEDGMPDIRKVAHELTEDVRIKDAEERGKKAGLEQGKKDTLASLFAKPSASGFRTGADEHAPELPEIKGPAQLEGAWSKVMGMAAQDEEILNAGFPSL